MKFNENLKYLRKKEGLTQEELAEKLNVSRQSVTKWESGQSLPDIEKVKEISYIFSVSVDSLIGNIETKTDNIMKKRIKDIGWFVFVFVVFAFLVIMSLYNFIFQVSQNENITIASMILIGIVTFMIFIAELKNYLSNIKETILNMKNTEEGKRERIKYITKNSCLFFGYAFILTVIVNINTLLEGFSNFISNVAYDSICELIFVFGVAFAEYRGLERKVKELNKDEE